MDKIENATFPYKIAWSEVNVKTNRMGSTKWNYHTSPSPTLWHTGGKVFQRGAISRPLEAT